MGEFFRRVGGYMPPPSPLAEPPPLWGSEPHVEELFDGTGIELEFEREFVRAPSFESPEAALEFLTSKFGPLMMARQLTEALGRWPELRGELIDQAERDEPAKDGGQENACGTGDPERPALATRAEQRGPEGTDGDESTVPEDGEAGVGDGQREAERGHQQPQCLRQVDDGHRWSP